MKVQQRQWIANRGWKGSLQESQIDANLVLVFGETNALKREEVLNDLRGAYPNAHLFGCSTAGEIQGARVYDDSVSATAIQFADTKVETASLHLRTVKDSFVAGETLAGAIPHAGLSHVLVLSVGLGVNGSELVKGLAAKLPHGVTMTGGLAADKARFQQTLVICDGKPSDDQIAIVGLYGSKIKIGSASLGGWDSFGPVRRVTKSSANVLYELDGKSALDLYKTYLGEHAQNLPGSALLFPLAIRSKNGRQLVRTVLAVDEGQQSMTFAGDLPEGSNVQLMKANFDRLIEGAVGAAENSTLGLDRGAPEVALLISCVGRKLVLKQRIEEEVEGVRDIFGEKTALTGFYSYGEISPFTPNAKCELHNQTMTITTLTEADEKAS